MGLFLLFVYLCVILLKWIGWPAFFVSVPWIVMFVPAIVAAFLFIVMVVAVAAGIVKLKK